MLILVVAVACSGERHGSMVDIGGRSLFIDCRGTGSPTVILERGLTADTTWWDQVIGQIAETTRVCAYDRANNGESDPVGSHTGDQSVSDLEELLAACNIEPPYVLAAWSFGGPIARLFAARHPDDVVGVLLVDTDPVDYRSLGAPFVPDDAQERSFWASENDEKLDLDATLDLARAESTPGSFDDHPLVILTPSGPNSGDIGEGGSQTARTSHPRARRALPPPRTRNAGPVVELSVRARRRHRPLHHVRPAADRDQRRGGRARSRSHRWPTPDLSADGAGAVAEGK